MPIILDVLNISKIFPQSPEGRIFLRRWTREAGNFREGYGRTIFDLEVLRDLAKIIFFLGQIKFKERLKQKWRPMSDTLK